MPGQRCLAMVGGNTKVIKDCLPFVITDGVPARARGLNVVGLRRAGVTASQLRTLKEAYRLLLRSGHSLAAALETLEDNGITVILVTHDPQVARNARRVIALRDGLVVQDTSDIASLNWSA